MTRLLLTLILVVLLPAMSNAQTPSSVICQFERIATAQVDDKGKISTGNDSSEGDLVLADLNTKNPTATGNLGSVKTDVIQRTKDAVWLVDYPPDTLFTHAPAETLTLFFQSGIVMHTKTETLKTLEGAMKPFGFVEIGRCKPVQ